MRQPKVGIERQGVHPDLTGQASRYKKARTVKTVGIGSIVMVTVSAVDVARSSSVTRRLKVWVTRQAPTETGSAVNVGF